MSVRVVNLKHYKRNLNEDLIVIDRSSFLGNPFHISKKMDRDAVIDLYASYFIDMITLDTTTSQIREKYGKFTNNRIPTKLEFNDRLNEVVNIAKIKDVALGCWCLPKRCHGFIIKKYLDTRR